MHINAAILGEQVAHQYQPFMNHGNERVLPLAPGVAVCQLFQDIRFFREFLIPDFNIHRKIRTDIKRRININQPDATLFFDFLTKRPVFQ